MMPEGEEAPAVGLSKALAVFDSRVDAVVGAVEEPASRWFCTRAVRESRTQKAIQFFDDNGSFWKRTRLQVRINVFLLDVDVMIFREARLSVVEAVRRQGSAHKDPLAKAGGKLHVAV